MHTAPHELTYISYAHARARARAHTHTHTHTHTQEPLSAHVNLEAQEKRTNDFTAELQNCLHDHFQEFASKKGCLTTPPEVEQLVRKWAYMVRFAGILLLT
jgi:hypothetical protein